MNVRAMKFPTSIVAASGLVAGFAVAQATGIRPLGGVVLAAAGGWCALTWYRRHGWPTTAALTGVYVGAFVISHPLAKQLGAWPSVATVAAVTAAAAYAASDRRIDSPTPAHLDAPPHR